MSVLENHKTFIEHLEELRLVIIRIIITVAILLPVTFFFADDTIQLLIKYTCPPGFSLRYFSPMEPLFVQIKISLLGAFIIGLPYIAYIGWKFLVPALYPEERRRIKQFALSSWFLFIAGVTFCFYFIIPAMMRFSLSMQSDELRPAIGLSKYIGIVGMLLIGFGVIFQLPIAVFFLVISGIVKLSTLRKQRAVVLIIILTLSALLTPPDIFSQIMMAVPTYLLFEFSLIFSSIAMRNQQKNETYESENIQMAENSDATNIPPAAHYDDDLLEPDNSSANYNRYHSRIPVKRKLRSRSKHGRIPRK
ncbi:MAG: twin-arginine translocase subunit TatC [Victivallaceae bacterium]|nr:twin-arginine translocase subunit TatC [Victivallaceae bacterium]